MQLKQAGSIRGALAMASCTLLAATPNTSNASDSSDQSRDPWKIDSAVLFYSEKDRVSVLEPVVTIRRAIGEEEFLNFKLVADTMTGSTPNGATATDKSQTFTTASGNDTYTIAPNQTPLRHFEDNRVAISADWEKPFSRTFRSILGANFSRETDYTSVGISSTFNWDFNNKLTTLGAGISAGLDFVQPQGGAPESFALLPKFNSLFLKSENEGEGNNGPGKRKVLADGLIGITQVVNRRTLMQLNYGIGRSSGYLTDPYKILSVVDGATGETVAYRNELRPDKRLRQTIYLETVYHLPKDVVHFSYRYYWDDWGIRAHTLDLHYRFELGGGHYLQPHLRYYTQTAADFYRFSLVQGEPLPDYASADYRLAALTSKTVGLKYGFPVGKGGELSLRTEYMHQTGNSHPADAIGIQKTQDLYPGLQAWIVQFGFKFEF